MSLKYVKSTPVDLKGNPAFTELWLQERIIDDPTILGLGAVEVRAIEKQQPRAGRLDLLLHNPETDQRYEVELMLGALDESHIIRTIEYWDIERKRYPQYDHFAVIVAEDITSRFLNVINLLNGAIPMIAIQMNAFQYDDKITLQFVKVIDEVVRGDDEEDETTAEAATNREYWEKKSSKKMLPILDECISLLRNIAPEIEPNYRQNYIGIRERQRPNNFIQFFPKVNFLRIRARISEDEQWREHLEEAGLDVMDLRKKGRLALRLKAEDLSKHNALLNDFLKAVYQDQQDSD